MKRKKAIVPRVRRVVVQFLEDLGKQRNPKGYNYYVDPDVDIECNDEIIATCQFGQKLVRVISVYANTELLHSGGPRQHLIGGDGLEL
jgi:hypothetical protein